MPIILPWKIPNNSTAIITMYTWLAWIVVMKIVIDDKLWLFTNESMLLKSSVCNARNAKHNNSELIPIECMLGIPALPYMAYDSITLIHNASAVSSTVIVMAPEPMLHTLIAYTADRLSVRYALKKNANIRHSEKNAMTINVIFNTVLNNDIMIMFSEQFSANMLAIAVHVNIPSMNLRP